MAAAYILQTSRFGIALRASREDEVAARSAGIRIWRNRLIAWTLSSFFLGIGGALYGHFVGVISVNAFYLDLTFICLAMLVVGGTRSLFGAVSGVLVISLASEVLRQFEAGVVIGSHVMKIPEGLQEVALGVLMLMVLIRFPRGLTGGREMRLPRFLAKALSVRMEPSGR
jgi:branched-chain amino acid transport system permease protein